MNSPTYLVLAALAAGTAAAHAANGTATITADNHYQFYTGSADGSVLNFIGRNETGSAGSPGTYNWSLPETWPITVGAGDFLYLVSWDDERTAEGWLGEFTLPGGTLLSNTTGWEYVAGSTADPGSGSLADLQVAANIAGASWLPLTAADDAGANGVAPWGIIPGISTSARWLDNGGNAVNNDVYRIFRAPAFRQSDLVAPVPEPATVAGGLALTALAGLAGWRRFRR
ncbi:MAG: hypothetical protein ACKVYV_02110 [Limisphaerales bacterium]